MARIDGAPNETILEKITYELTRPRGKSKKIKTADQVFLLERLGLLIEAMSMAEAVDHLHSFSKGGRKRALEGLSRALQNGKSVGEGLDGFVDQYTAESLKVAEEKGDLPTALRELAEAKKEESGDIAKIFLGFLYPLLISSIASMLVLQRWPDIHRIIIRAGKTTGDLPYQYHFISGLSYFINNILPTASILLVGFIFYAWYFIKMDTSPIRARLDNFGPFQTYRMAMTHKFMAPFSLLTRFGVSDAEAVELIRGAKHKGYFQHHLISLTSGIQSGRALSTAMDTGLLDAESVSLIKATTDTSDRDKGIKTVSEDAHRRYLLSVRRYALVLKSLLYGYAAITAAMLVSVFTSLDQIFSTY